MEQKSRSNFIEEVLKLFYYSLLINVYNISIYLGNQFVMKLSNFNVQCSMHNVQCIVKFQGTSLKLKINDAKVCIVNRNDVLKMVKLVNKIFTNKSEQRVTVLREIYGS